jgi:predicted HicB family RNase H-like nuclease
MSSNAKKLEEIQLAAEEFFQAQPDWVSFYREVMGLSGLVRRAFPTKEAMAAFEQSETNAQIQLMIAELRKKPIPKHLEEEERVVTLRIPLCMHEALRIEAFAHHTSMNKLCISKLLHFVDAQNVPAAIEEKKVEASL